MDGGLRLEIVAKIIHFERDEIRKEIYLIVNTISKVLCFEAKSTVFIINRSLTTFDLIKIGTRVELKGVLTRFNRQGSTSLLVNESLNEQK